MGIRDGSGRRVTKKHTDLVKISRDKKIRVFGTKKEGNNWSSVSRNNAERPREIRARVRDILSLL